MKTLRDYIKGYGFVPILLLADFSDNGDRYYLCKEYGHNSFYYMKGNEVLDIRYITGDELEKLSIKYLNDKNNPELKERIEKQISYQAFVKFISDNCNKKYSMFDN